MLYQLTTDCMGWMLLLVMRLQYPFLILYTSLIFIIKNDYVIYVLLFLSLFSSYNLYTNIKLNNQNQWWSKKFQLLISLFVLLFSILSIYNKNEYNYRKFIIITLYISLFGGIIQSINNL